MLKSLLFLRIAGNMTHNPRPGRVTRGGDAMRVIIFFTSLAVISVCLFVFVESYPRHKPSPEYEQAAQKMRESRERAVLRAAESGGKLDVRNGRYVVVER